MRDKSTSVKLQNDKRPIKRLAKFFCIVLICAFVFFIVDYLLADIADKKAYPQRTGISENYTLDELYAINNPGSDDYIKIFNQTGLGQAAVDNILEKNQRNKIVLASEYFQRDIHYICDRNGVATYDEYVTDEKGEKSYNPDFVDLQNGDVLVTLSIHTLGYRHGHAAVVVDAQRGLIAHSVRFGENSQISSIREYAKYPLVAVLRLKENSEETGKEIAEYITDNMMDIPYNLLATSYCNTNKAKPATTQCAHFVWYAYSKFGYDINSDGGWLVTPTDILNCNDFNIVQLYGFDPAMFDKDKILIEK